eukprot:1159740-Pelagomonas_calceolata.AAC.3
MEGSQACTWKDCRLAHGRITGLHMEGPQAGTWKDCRLAHGRIVGLHMEGPQDCTWKKASGEARCVPLAYVFLACVFYAVHDLNDRKQHRPRCATTILFSPGYALVPGISPPLPMFHATQKRGREGEGALGEAVGSAYRGVGGHGGSGIAQGCADYDAAAAAAAPAQPGTEAAGKGRAAKRGGSAVGRVGQVDWAGGNEASTLTGAPGDGSACVAASECGKGMNSNIFNNNIINNSSSGSDDCSSDSSRKNEHTATATHYKAGTSSSAGDIGDNGITQASTNTGIGNGISYSVGGGSTNASTIGGGSSSSSSGAYGQAWAAQSPLPPPPTLSHSAGAARCLPLGLLARDKSGCALHKGMKEGEGQVRVF